MNGLILNLFLGFQILFYLFFKIFLFEDLLSDVYNVNKYVLFFLSPLPTHLVHD